MAISQLRVLASVGPARAAGAEGQAPGQDMEKREREMVSQWGDLGLELVQALANREQVR